MSQTDPPSTHATPGSTPHAIVADFRARPEAAGHAPAQGAFALAWHITRKDLRAVAVMAVLWTIVTAAHAIGTWMPPSVTMAPSQRAVLQSLVDNLPLIRLLLFVLIAALLVHADPLVSTDAFWLTRPIPRRVLFASKLLTAAIVLALPSLVAQFALMAAFGVPAADLARVTPDLVLSQVAGIAFVLLAAALTSSLTSLLLWSVCLLSLGWIALMVWIQAVADDPRWLDVPVPGPRDPTREVVDAVVFVLGLVAALWYMYRERRRGRTILAVLAAVAIADVAARSWPDVSLYGGEPQLQGEWASDAARSPVRLARDVRQVQDINHYGPHASGYRQISAPIVLDGVPAGSKPYAFTVRATVRAANGVVLESLRAEPTPVRVDRETAVPALAMADTQNPASDLSQKVGETWPVLFRVPLPALRQAGISSGEYEGTFQYSFGRIEPLATLPLRHGTRQADGPRSVAFWPMAGHGDTCEVLVQVADWNARTARLTDPALKYTFRHRTTRQPLAFNPTWPYNNHAAFSGIILTENEPFHVSKRGLAIRYPSPDPATGAQPGTAGAIACSDVDVELVRESYAGRFLRTLKIPQFHLELQPGDLKGDPYR